MSEAWLPKLATERMYAAHWTQLACSTDPQKASMLFVYAQPQALTFNRCRCYDECGQVSGA